MGNKIGKALARMMILHDQKKWHKHKRHYFQKQNDQQSNLRWSQMGIYFGVSIFMISLQRIILSNKAPGMSIS